MPPPPSSQNLLIIISGPAGSGKTTLCEKLLEEFGDSIERVVTTTSRRPRPGEVDGVDYHFIPANVFKKRIQAGEFIEWALVHGRYYGSDRDTLIRMLEGKKDVLMSIDVQGAQTFLAEGETNPALAGRIRTIFIQPRSLEQIRERLLYRGSDDEPEIQRRLRSAEEEIRVAESFDHIIVSGSRDADFAALRQLYLEMKAPVS